MGETKIIDRRGESKGLNTNFWTSLNNPGTGGYDGPAVSDLQLLSAYVNNDVVYTCADRNAQAVASADWCLYRPGSTPNKSFKTRKLSKSQKALLRTKALQADDEDVVEVVDHKIIDLLTKTSEDLNGRQILKATQIYLEVLGRAYWFLERDGLGEPEQITVLKAHFVSPQRDIEGRVVNYLYTNVIDGKREEVVLKKDDVIDFRQPSINDLYAGGMSWLRAVYSKVAAGSKWSEWMNWLLDNRARPDYVINPAGDMSDPAALDRLEKKLSDRLKGGNNGRPLVTDQRVQITPLNFSPVDMAPLAVNKEMAQAVCNASGVPVPLVLGDATYSNMQTALELWMRQAIQPRLHLIEQVINDSLLPLFGDDQLYIEFANPIPEDLEFKLQEQTQEDVCWAKAIDALALTKNEIRERLGLDPIDGGDDLPQPPSVPPTAPGADPDAQDGDDAPPDPSNNPDAGGQSVPTKALPEGLLEVNRFVAAGEMDRATAINVVAEMFGGDEQKARRMVTHPRKAEQQHSIEA